MASNPFFGILITFNVWLVCIRSIIYTDHVSTPDGNAFILNANDQIHSSNGSANLIMQGDGNFVLYHPYAVWHTNTATQGSYASLQWNGNLRVYDASHLPVWGSDSKQGDTNAPYHLVVSNHGYAYILNTHMEVTWTTLSGQIYPTFAPPTGSPTLEPTPAPQLDPTLKPTLNPSDQPTLEPTMTPTLIPTLTPTELPSNQPTFIPTPLPTSNPTDNPSLFPTMHPTSNPTFIPSTNPTFNPTSNPSVNPSMFPTNYPNNVPTSDPTEIPSFHLSVPTIRPTHKPTKKHYNVTETINQIIFSTRETIINEHDDTNDSKTFWDSNSKIIISITIIVIIIIILLICFSIYLWSRNKTLRKYINKSNQKSLNKPLLNGDGEHEYHLQYMNMNKGVKINTDGYVNNDIDIKKNINVITSSNNTPSVSSFNIENDNIDQGLTQEGSPQPNQKSSVQTVNTRKYSSSSGSDTDTLIDGTPTKK